MAHGLVLVVVHEGKGGHRSSGYAGDMHKVKFIRQDLVNVPTGGAVTLTVTEKVWISILLIFLFLLKLW